MTLRQEFATHELISEYIKLGKEIDPYSYEEIPTIISVWEQFKENYTDACKNIKEEMRIIKADFEDDETILDLINEINEQLDYMESL